MISQLLLKYQGACSGSISTTLMYPLLMEQVMFSLKSQNNKPSSIRFSDLEDIQDAQNGDSDAFRRLVERYQAHLSRLLWRFTRDSNDHEELIQESFVQAYKSLHTYRAQAPFEHWLARIATRVGYRFWKQQQRHTHISLQDSDQQNITDGQDSMNPGQAAELVHALLAKLPPRDRLVLTLRYLEQYSVEQTAQQTGWSISLVKVQSFRAKQKLKKLLEKTNIGFEKL